MGRRCTVKGAVRAVFLSVAVLILAIPVVAGADDLLKSITVSPTAIDVSKGESAGLSWQQSSRGILDVSICTLDGQVVKTFHHRSKSAAGAFQISWDGRNDQGQMCPDGAYLPFLKLRTKTRGGATYNPTTFPWGNKILIENIAYDHEAQEIHYTLETPALCLVRSGEGDGGPCYKTLFDWSPRDAGTHRYPWDGKAVTGGIEVWQREKLNIVLDGFTLPPNAILLTGSGQKLREFEFKGRRLPLRPPHGEQIYLHAMHRRELCHDMTIGLSVLKSRGTTDGVPVLGRNAVLKVSAGANMNYRQLEREKIELYCFIDGQLLFEGPYPALPAKLKVDTSEIPNGDHLLTVNLRTFEDHVGTYSMRIRVEH